MFDLWIKSNWNITKSHRYSIGISLKFFLSLLCMFDATCEVLQNAIEDGNYSLRDDANSAYDILTS